SETELAARYRVSQGTVRKAIDELAAGNLLVRRQGRGTFVASHHEVRTQFRFLRIRPDEAGDERPEADRAPLLSRILECRRLRAPVEVARQLRLRSGEPVVQIRRLLELEQPAVLDEIWLPGSPARAFAPRRTSGGRPTRDRGTDGSRPNSARG